MCVLTSHCAVVPQVSDAIYAVTQLAQTTMRSELGKMTLDRTFAERESLNSAIVAAINEASASWGIHCLRYEIRAWCLLEECRAVRGADRGLPRSQVTLHPLCL